MSTSQEDPSVESDIFPELRDERYKPEKLLGKGRSGLVYLARDTNLGKYVVIKSLRGELATGEEIQRFQQEARTLSGLHHAHILNVLDFGLTSLQSPYLVTDYVEGETLFSLITRVGTLDETDSIAIVRQICTAMAHAHSRGVIHRDLKPQNILISQLRDKKYHAIIFDFGLAKLYAKPGELRKALTRPGQILGTAEYMSPEQATGELCTIESDVYSVGCIMFEMLSGKAPFEATSILEVLNKQINAPAPIDRLKEVTPRLTPQIVAIVTKMLDKEPSRRFRSMNEVAQALEDLDHMRRLRASSRPLKQFREEEDDPTLTLPSINDDLPEDEPVLENEAVKRVLRETTQILPPDYSTKPKRRLNSNAVLLLVTIVICILAIIGFIFVAGW